MRRNAVNDRTSLILIANDTKKPAARALVREFGAALDRKYSTIYATRGTAKVIQPYLKQRVEKLSHGPAGGDVEAAHLMFKLGGRADIFFLIDPMHEPHECQKDLLVRVCQSNDWPIYTTPSSVDGYLRALAPKPRRRPKAKREETAAPPLPVRLSVVSKDTVAANEKAEAATPIFARPSRRGRSGARF